MDDHLSLRVELPAISYEILVGTDLLNNIGDLIKKHVGEPRKVVVIADNNVGPLYSQVTLDALRDGGYKPDYIEISAGEEGKSLENSRLIFEKLLDLKADRDAFLIALGGGVVGDQVGFVASTFMRGIDYVQLPTTLLAQVDSSVGGKTAVNLPVAKNIIGSFHQPQLVVIDLSTLKSLPERELKAGLAEVIKYGFLSNQKLLQSIEKHLDDINSGNYSHLKEIVKSCCAFKADIVRQDERDLENIRAILNYGHTIGHAIEAVSGYQGYVHGEAVSIGMIGAAMMSDRMGLIGSDIVEKHVSLLKLAGLPIRYKGLEPKEIMAHMELDKKRKESEHIMILLEGIGKPIVTSVNNEMLAGVLSDLKED